jgi:hypothetical protein
VPSLPGLAAPEEPRQPNLRSRKELNHVSRGGVALKLDRYRVQHLIFIFAAQIAANSRRKVARWADRKKLK